jgi:ferredoxin
VLLSGIQNYCWLGVGFPLTTRGNDCAERWLSSYENLPFAQANPHGWIRDYCETCNICVQKCPADAIYLETKTLAGGGPALINHTKCAKPFSNDNGCTLCIKYCPFSYADYTRLKGWFEAGQPASRQTGMIQKDSAKRQCKITPPEEIGVSRASTVPFQ